MRYISLITASSILLLKATLPLVLSITLILISAVAASSQAFDDRYIVDRPTVQDSTIRTLADSYPKTQLALLVAM